MIHLMTYLTVFLITPSAQATVVNIADFMQKYSHLECSTQTRSGTRMVTINRVDQKGKRTQLKILRYESARLQEIALKRCETELGSMQISIQNIDSGVNAETGLFQPDDRKMLYVILDKKSGKRVHPGWYPGTGVASRYDATLKNMAEILFERLN